MDQSGSCRRNHSSPPNRKNDPPVLGWVRLCCWSAFSWRSAVFGLTLARQQATQPTSGQAPDFALTTFDGQTFKLSDLQRQGRRRQFLGELVRSVP